MKEKQGFLRSNGSKLGVKIDQKTMPKRGQLGKVSWHRFFFDFGGFWETGWEGKSSQDQRKSGLKIWCKTRAASNVSWVRFGPILAPRNNCRGIAGGHSRPLIFVCKISFVLDVVFCRPKTPQDAPPNTRFWTLQDVPMISARRPRRPPRCPETLKTPPRWPETSQDVPKRFPRFAFPVGSPLAAEKIS